MLKRVFACALALLLALGAVAALAEDVTYIGDMTVVNCEEWVSLREEPSTSARRLKKVPLGATVTDAAWEDGQGDFMYCCYDGVYGYILSSYLTADTTGDAVLDATIANLRILAERAYVGGGEYLLVTCEDAGGAQRWFYETMTDDVTELTLTDAFIGGWAQNPLVLVYNAEEGLTALEPFTGETVWTLPEERIHLGASISYAVDGATGVAYIGGYYGPDPVAIDMNGNVLWQSNAGSGDIFWLTSIEARDNGLACYYASMGESSGYVIYGYNGLVQEVIYD